MTIISHHRPKVKSFLQILEIIFLFVLLALQIADLVETLKERRDD